MDRFYEHELKTTNEYTYTAVPYDTWGVYIFLEDHHIPYEVLQEFEAPDGLDVQRGLAFAKEIGQDDICIIKARVDSDDLFKIAKETHGMPAGEIGTEFDPDASLPGGRREDHKHGILGLLKERKPDKMQGGDDVEENEQFKMPEDLTHISVSDEEALALFAKYEAATAATKKARPYQLYKTHFED